VQVGKEDLSFAELLALDREWLLHLHDHLGAREDVIGVGGNGRAGSLVVRIGEPGTDAGIGFDQDLMAVRGQFAHGRGHEPDAEFVVLDLLGHADKHDFRP
jgi:hypothetical protein